MIAERQPTITRDYPAPPTRVSRTVSRRPQHAPYYPGSRPMGERGSRVVRRVRALSWSSPMSIAVLVASFLVSLAALYVSAYARIAMQSAEKVSLIRQLHSGEQRSVELHARVSELTLGSMVRARAIQMKMESNSPLTADLLLSSDSRNALAAGVAPAPASTDLSSRKIVQ